MRNEQFASWQMLDELLTAVAIFHRHREPVQFGNCRGRSSNPSGIMQIVTSAVRVFFYDAPLDPFSFSNSMS